MAYRGAFVAECTCGWKSALVFATRASAEKKLAGPAREHAQTRGTHRVVMHG